MMFWDFDPIHDIIATATLIDRYYVIFILCLEPLRPIEWQRIAFVFFLYFLLLLTISIALLSQHRQSYTSIRFDQIDNWEYIVNHHLFLSLIYFYFFVVVVVVVCHHLYFSLLYLIFYFTTLFKRYYHHHH